METAGRIAGVVVGVLVGIVFLHIPTFGTWLGLFVIVGALAGLINPLMRQGSTAQALVIFAALFVAVYRIIPWLRHLGPHHGHWI